MSARTLAIVGILLLPLAADAQPVKQRLDAHGFPLPDGAVARLGNLQFVAPGSISAIAMSPDGKLIASAGGPICIFDADSGRIVRRIETKDSIASLIWSKNGRLLLAMRHNTEFTIWNAHTGEAHWQQNGLMSAARANVLATRFIDDDRLLAIALVFCRVELWDIKQAKLARTWHLDDAKRADLKALGMGYDFTYVSLSPSGEKMAWLAREYYTKTPHCAVLVYETVSGKLLHVVKGLEMTERICLVDEGQTIVCDPVWSAKEGPRYASVSVPEGRVRFYCNWRVRPPLMDWPSPAPSFPGSKFTGAMDVCKNGDSLFAADGIGMIRWDATTGKKLHEWNEQQIGPAFSADGKRAVIAQGIRLTLCDGGLKPLRDSAEFSSFAWLHFQADGRLVVHTSRGGRLSIWDLKQNKIVETLMRHDAPDIGRGPWSSDARFSLFAYQKEKRLAIRDLVANRDLCCLDDVESFPGTSSLYFTMSPDGKRTLTCLYEKDGLLVRWFDSYTGRELGRYRIAENVRYTDVYTPVSWYSNDGNMFGYIAADTRLVLVDCTQKKVTQVLGVACPSNCDPPLNRKGYAKWSYDSAGQDRLILATHNIEKTGSGEEYRVYDRDTGRRLRRFSLNAQHVLLSPDGRLAAIDWHGGSKEVRIYETATGRLRGKFDVPGGGTYSCDFAPDCRTLATSCEDTTVLIWDLHRSWSSKPALPAPRSAEDADKLWQTLGDPDPQSADPALWALVAAPEHALPILKQRLQPVRSPDADSLHKRIAALDSAPFRERTVAADELLRLGELAVPALQAAVKQGAGSLEQKRRIDELLARIDEPVESPAYLRELRAVEVLERIGLAEARKVVESLAAGDAGALLTAEARVALARMRK